MRVRCIGYVEKPRNQWVRVKKAATHLAFRGDGGSVAVLKFDRGLLCPCPQCRVHSDRTAHFQEWQSPRAAVGGSNCRARVVAVAQ
jgi:hypothetical protein